MADNIDDIIFDRPPEIQNRIRAIIHESGIQDHDGLWVIIKLIDAYSHEFGSSARRFESSINKLMIDSENEKKEIIKEIKEYSELSAQVTLANLTAQISINEKGMIDIFNENMAKHNDTIKETIRREIKESASSFFISDEDANVNNGASVNNYSVEPSANKAVSVASKIIICGALIGVGAFYSEMIINAIKIII